jgi:hypothetical protein
MKMKKLAALGLAFLTLSFFASAQEAKDAKPTSPSFARLSYVDGNAYIQRAADLAYEEGQVNMPIAEGDRIGTTDGRVEIYLGKKNYLRLDQNAKVDFLNLPKNNANLIRVRQWAGNLYLDVATLEKEKAIEVLTSDATFYILDKGLYRIDVNENKETEILVFSGMAEASGENGSMLVKKEQRLSVSEGRFLSNPSSFFASVSDAFDTFNDNRDTKVNRQLARRYLSGDLADFEYELDEYGDWVNDAEFGNVWVPRGLASDWRPYYYGRWSWLPMAGWCWIPYEPWGWSTFHYGRWQWGMNMGWYWIPMNMWGPAWVNWWWDNDYFAWAPMSYWGYPGIIIDNFYYGRGWRNYNEYPNNSRALTVIHRNQLQAHDIHKAALGPDTLKSVGRLSLVNRALDVKPSGDRRISIEQMDGGKRVILRKSGEGGTAVPTSGRTERTIGKDRENAATKTGEQKDASGQKGTDPKAIPPKVIDRDKKGETPPPDKTVVERKIRKKEEGGGPVGGASNSGRSMNSGYPAAKEISRESSSQGTRVSRQGSVMDKFYKFFSGERGSSSPRLASPPNRSAGSFISPSVPRMMPSPSPSRGSSGSHPSVTKKK